MTKRTNYEFLIVLLGGIMANLAKLEKEEPEPEFIETIEITYVPPPAPLEVPPDRVVLGFDEEAIYAPDTEKILTSGVTF